jgi:hypothetical protein
LTSSISGKTTFFNPNKRKYFSKSSSISKIKQTAKHRKMRVAIPKIYFPLDPQDDMDGYLKNTEKMATLTLRILDREQKINHYLKTFANQLGGYVLAFYPQDKYTNGLTEKVVHTFQNIMESFKPFCNFGGALDLDMLAYCTHEQYKNMIATLEYCGFTIFNPEIVLKLSDRARLEDRRHGYCHNTLNDKLTPASQKQLLRVEFHPDLPGIQTYYLGSNRPEEY